MFQEIVEKSPLGMVAVEGSLHTVRYANPAFCLLVKKDSHELVGRPFAEVIVEGPANRCIKLFDRVFRTGQSAGLLEQQHSGQTLAYWSYVAWAIGGDSGNPIGVMIHVTDTTESVLFHQQLALMNQELMMANVRQHELVEQVERLSASELARREELFRTMANAIPQLAWIAKDDGYTYWYNQRWFDYTGTTQEEIDGWGWQRVYDPNVLPLVLEQWRASLSTGSPLDMVCKLRGADGVFRPFLTRVMPLKDEQGQVRQWFGTHTDISEQKRVEDALRNSEQRYRDLVELSPDAIFINRNDKITFANRVAVELLGAATEEEVIGKSPYDFFPSEYHPKLRKRLAKVLFGEKASLIEGRIVRLDGQIRDVEVTSGPFKDEQGAAIQVVLRDISESKQARKEREELEAHVQREHRLESIGILAGGVAHDFNNLLAGLFGYVEAACRYAESGAISQVTSSLGKALGALGRAKDLTQQLLTFAKGGAPAMKVADISQALKASGIFALSGSNVEVNFQVAQDLWPCRFDANQISQAFDNILINAKEAMPEGGRISVRAENLPKGSALPEPLPPENYVLISITDQGSGIKPEALEHIFDPFFTTKETGHGLGLSIVHSIIRKHGGYIHVDSKLGKGTTVKIYLTAESEAVIMPLAEERSSEAGAQGKILVMDDEPVVQEVIGAMLEGIGYSVVLAENGEEAIRCYEEALKASRPFDVTILDLTVRGGLGGKETIKKLLEIDPAIKALVSSGYSNDPIMANPVAYGFKGALTKPFHSKDLYNTLRAVIGNNVSWQQAG